MSEPANITPECWCAYGREGREAETPGCPEHDPTGPQPYVRPDGIECETCAEGPQDCDCGGEDENCIACGGTGECIPEHCCACGGSPYCHCCSTCGSPNAGQCQCPVTVQLSDGGTKTL